MKLRKLSAVLIGAMCLSLLSGCGAGSDAKISKDMKKKYNSYVTLGDYSKIEYTAQHTEVTDEDIQMDIDNLLKSKTEKAKVTDRVATMGDSVNIDYVGSVDGVEFDGGNTKGQGADLVLGSKSYIDTFEEQIAGHKPGETFEVNVTFPDPYQGNADLSGKKAVFKTTLNYIQGDDIVPEFNDEFVAANTDYKTVADYKQAMREKHEENNSNSDAQANNEAIINAVIESSAVGKYPEQEMQDRIDLIVSGMQETAESNGIDLSTMLAYYGYDADSFMTQISDNVKSYFTRRIVVCAIAYKENITCSEDEAEALIQQLLKDSGMTDVDTMNKQYGYKNDDYYYSVLEKKVIDFLKTKAVASPSDAESK